MSKTDSCLILEGNEIFKVRVLDHDVKTGADNEQGQLTSLEYCCCYTQRTKQNQKKPTVVQWPGVILIGAKVPADTSMVKSRIFLLEQCCDSSQYKVSDGNKDNSKQQ